MVSEFRNFPLRNFKPEEAIGLGALVSLKLGQKKALYFVAAHGGGISVQFDGEMVHVITTQSPIGDAVFGRKVGEIVEVEAQNAVREYEVLEIS